VAEGSAPLLDGPDPLLTVEPVVAVREDAGGLLQHGCSLADTEAGTAMPATVRMAEWACETAAAMLRAGMLGRS
jgi:hypothetical protein